MSDSSFKITTEHTLLKPKSENAYTIACSEWDRLKREIDEIDTSTDFFNAAGWALVGASLSTLTSILTGSIPYTSLEPSKFITAWAITAVTAVCGGLALYFGLKSKDAAKKRAASVISLMKLVEQRFHQ